jgi:predicted nucleic acid-binding protein
VTLDRSPDEAELLRLARRHGLTAYDASYLELARRDALPLATLDADLTRAARAEGLSLLGDVGARPHEP